MGIVPSAFSGYCTDLTATPTWVKPLPGSSPIKMCRNAERGKTSGSWIHTLRPLPHCGVDTATANMVVYSRNNGVSSLFYHGLQTDRPSYDHITAYLKERFELLKQDEQPCAQAEDNCYKDILKRINPPRTSPSTSSVNSFSSGR